jgi:hypothetical protein
MLCYVFTNPCVRCSARSCCIPWQYWIVRAYIIVHIIIARIHIWHDIRRAAENRRGQRSVHAVQLPSIAKSMHRTNSNRENRISPKPDQFLLSNRTFGRASTHTKSSKQNWACCTCIPSEVFDARHDRDRFQTECLHYDETHVEKDEKRRNPCLY